jgi:hypothetical protein
MPPVTRQLGRALRRLGWNVVFAHPIYLILNGLGMHYAVRQTLCRLCSA